MKRWLTKPLGEICELVNGAPFKPSDWDGTGLPIIRIQNLNDSAKPFNYTSKILPEKFRVRPGDTLLSWSGTPGTSFGCFRWNGPEGWLNQHIFNCYLRKEVLPSFFINQVNSKLDELIGKAHGGVGLQHITKGALSSVMVTFPPLAEQGRIVKLLDAADELRKLRAQADTRTAALLPALFNEMFGDPIKNTKKWPQDLFANVGKLDRGRSKNRPRDEPSLYGGKYPFIQTGDVANSNGQITSHTQTYSERGLAQSRMWPAQTLVITIAANIGKTAILTFPACFPDSMVGFIPGEKVLVDYVRQWLVTMESRLEEAAPQMAQKNINLRILSELTIPVPPLPLQKEFAQRVTEIRELEAAQSASRQRLEALFQSMLHRAFNGEL